MSRRSFVPSSEGLEDRTMQATNLFGSGSSLLSGTTNVPNPALTQPFTPQEKQQRVNHLPFYLGQTQPGRTIPAATLTKLQTDLYAIIGKLGSPPSAALNGFNLVLRDVQPHNTLSPSMSAELNIAFGDVLHKAGATPEAQAQLQDDMNDLALADIHSVNPVFLASNDYATVLQVALGVGRPIRTPEAPVLSPQDIVGNATTSHVTSSRQPRLVGTYDPNATVNLININGVVLGTTTAGPGGRYSVRPTVSLSNGVYVVQVQGVESGFASDPSPTYTFRVNTSGNG